MSTSGPPAGVKTANLLASVQWTGEPDDPEMIQGSGRHGSEASHRSPCSYLSIRRKNGTSYVYASDEHRCFWGGYRLRISIEQQEEYCVLNRLTECPLALRIMPRPVRVEADEQGEPRRSRSRIRSAPKQSLPLWRRLLGKG